MEIDIRLLEHAIRSLNAQSTDLVENKIFYYRFTYIELHDMEITPNKSWVPEKVPVEHKYLEFRYSRRTEKWYLICD